MISIIKNVNGEIETADIVEEEVPLLAEYLEMKQKMKDKGCKSLVVKIDEEFKVLYEIT